MYKEVTEAQLTAVLIITVRNRLGWEVNTITPVETVRNILSSVVIDVVISTGHPRVKWVADPVICNALELLSLILKLERNCVLNHLYIFFILKTVYVNCKGRRTNKVAIFKGIAY